MRPLADSDRADITDIRFLTGLAAIAAGERAFDPSTRAALLDEAIAALRAILIDRPELTRVRLELARAFFLARDDDLSRRHFERVLAGDPQPAMAANIRRFLHTIRARRKWSGYLSLGIEQNDNINSGSDTETVYIFGLPFTLNEESRPRARTGLALLAGGEYQHPLANRERWRWGFGADLARNEYAGHEFDQTYLRLRSGPRWLISKRSEASLQGLAGKRWVARNRHSDDFGVRFAAHHQLNRRLGFNAQVSWEKTRLRQARGLDDTEVEYELGGVYRFSPLVRARAGFGFSHQRREDGLRIRERRANIGLDVILSKGWSVGGSLSVLQRRHNRNAPFSTQRRTDRRRTARLFVLNRQLTFVGFSPQLIVSRERQKSNSALDNYRRTRADLRFVRQF